VAEESSTLTLEELGRIVRKADPSAFVVPARIVRRAVKHAYRLPGLALRVPHRGAIALDRSRGEVVDRDELGLAEGDELPSPTLLIAGPDVVELLETPRGVILRNCWRSLFHLRIHQAIEAKLPRGPEGASAVVERICRIGYPAFEEARAVLRQEDRLIPPGDDRSAYVEFAALYLELRAFDDHLIPYYFPALTELEVVDRLLAKDVDARALLASTRLPGACLPGEDVSPASTEPADPVEADEPEARSSERYRRLNQRADRAASLGNHVRAAILRTQAARLVGPSLAGQARSAASIALQNLANRLRTALGSTEVDPGEWRLALGSLIDRASRGVWKPEARLLYDLQKACVDRERQVFAVDLSEWILSRGQRSVKRPLPNHQEVMMVQHLRGARRHLPASRLGDAERTRLARLLEGETHHAERRLRDRLRPEVAAALEQTGFAPRNLPERVAVQKLNEELLDKIVERGFFSMGDLRDAVSRNNRKLPDLAGPIEFFRGDRLLQLDNRLADLLDGVYRRGEIYLRTLQRLSALAFGTRVGRTLTLFVALPYGGTYVVLKFLQHLLEPVAHWWIGEEIVLLDPVFIAINGTVLLGLINFPRYRRLFLAYLGRGFRGIHRAVAGATAWLLERDWVQRLMSSPELAIAARAGLVPAVVALIAWSIRPVSITSAQAVPATILLFVTTSLLLSTRAGRNVEEKAVDLAGRAWSWLFSSFFPGLFRLIVETFRRVLEAIERVLYTVDEWLRFRGGDGSSNLAVKAVVGLAWGMVAYVVRFGVTLLIEPQVNPIKHFPVVTVSHKIMVGFAPGLLPVFKNLLGPERGPAVMGIILLLMPGVFGFLVWELKENWRLYQANRPKTLRPVAIGHHGETMSRLLKPGFHSGTIPKLFSRLRKAGRTATLPALNKAARKTLAQMHEVEEAIRHFLDRDFLALLLQGNAMAAVPLVVEGIELGPRRVLVDLARPGYEGPSLRLSFEERGGWLVAGVEQPGWLDDLSLNQRLAVASALAGLYKMAGAELVREPIAEAIGPEAAIEVRDGGISVRLEPASQLEILYPMSPDPTDLPPPGFPSIQVARLVYAEAPILWSRWVEVWEADRAGNDHPAELVEGFPLLPPVVESPFRMTSPA
jgi:hypothetical protein